MQFGAIDDHARFTVIAQFVECKRTADHVAGEPLTSFGIGGLAADAVVHRETRVSPLAHAMGEIGSEGVFFAQEIEHFVAQRFAGSVLGQQRQYPKCAGRKKHAIGYQGMDMRVEGHEVAEGLHVQDEGGLTARLYNRKNANPIMDFM